ARSRALIGLAAGLVACGGASRGAGPRPGEDGAAPDREAPALVTTERGARGGRLVLVDEAGRRLADLVPTPPTPAVDSNPAWSPDGASVVFASSRQRASLAESNLWIVPARGGPARRLSA